MNVTVERVDTVREERVLLAMIVSTEFMTRTSRTVDMRAFSKPGRIVATWCMQYFEKYDKVPGNDLNIIFDSSLELSNEDREFVGGLLSKISSISSEQFNVDYYIDQSVEFFRDKKLNRLVSQIKNDLISGKTDVAENRVVQYMKVDKEESTGLDLFTDIERLKVMGFSPTAQLFTPPGAFGEMTGPIRRQDFIMYVGKSKVGKTQLLQQHGIWAALENGLRVLHLSLEMSEEEVKDRYYSAFTGLPVTYFRGNKMLSVPYFTDEGLIEYRQFSPDLMTPQDIVEKAPDLHMMAKGGKLVVESRPQDSFTVRDLKMLLEKYETVHDTVFDVIVLDYADLMAPSSGNLEYRHKLNDIYIALRGLTQERNIAIITVSQGNREGFKKDNVATTVSEDIRKLATVTGAFAINVTDEEKDRKYWRLSPLVLRHQRFNESDTVICLNCLDISRMVLDSRWSTETILTEGR